VTRKVGLVLGSGGARGWAHIGIVRALAEAGLEPDILCGTSVGAVIGALHITGQLPEFAAWVARLNRVKLSRFFDFRFGAGGFIAGKRVMESLQQHFGELRIEDMPRAFACVATDLNSGDEVWLRGGRLLDALRASYAIPGILPPMKVEGRWLIDGALVNPVPVSLARALGADLVIAVDVNADRLSSTQGDEDKMDLGQRDRWDLRGYFARDAGGHSPFGVLARTLQIVQTRITRTRLGEDPPDFAITPKIGHIGQLEYYRAPECIAAGEAAVRDALPALRAALGFDPQMRESGQGIPKVTAP
jgi:NTE family protein